jgi:TRAP-type C4-dicarboxylate transport system permease small subunit
MKLKKIYLTMHYVVDVLDKFALLSMIIIVSAEVISRNIFNAGISWSYEMATKLMAWFAFLSMAQGVKEKTHLSITIFHQLLPKKLKIIVDKFAYFAVLIFGILITNYGIKLTISTWSSTLPATQLPAGILYLVTPVAGILITLDAFIFLLGVDKYYGIQSTDHLPLYKEV